MYDLTFYLEYLRQTTRQARELLDALSASDERTRAAVALLIEAEYALQKSTAKTISDLEKLLYMLADAAKALSRLTARDSCAEN